MTSEKEVGNKTSLYCSVCQEERTFVWSEWSSQVFFGYMPTPEYGWECTTCGNRVIPEK